MAAVPIIENVIANLQKGMPVRAMGLKAEE